MQRGKAMRERITQKRAWFWKFLFSYLLILVVPLAMVFSFLNHKVFETLEEHLFEKQMDTITRLQEMMDLNLQQLVSIHTEMSLNNQMNPLDSMQDVQKVQQLMQTLKRYVIATPWLYDVVVAYPNDPYLYTSTTTCTVDRYFSQLLKLEDEDSQQTLQEYFFYPEKMGMQMKMIPAQTISYSGKKRELLPVVFALQVGTHSQTGTALYFIDMQVLRDWVLSSNQKNAEQYLILDPKGGLVAGFGKNISHEEIEQWVYGQHEWIQRKNLEYQVVNIRGETYMLCRAQSENNGFVYLSASSMKEIYNSVDGLKLRLVLVTAFAGVLGIAIAAYSLKKNYAPIQKLTTYAKTFLPEQEATDEMQTIHSSMEHISHQYTQLKENSSIAFQNHFLQRLLQGEYSNCTYLDTIGYVGDVHFQWENFVVLILRFAKDCLEILPEQALQQICRSHLEGYLQRGNDKNSYIYLANFPQSQAQSLRQDVAQIYQQLEQAMPKSKLVVAVGESCTQLAQVPHSYETAVLAADYRFVQGNNCIIWHGDLSFDALMVEAYPKQMFEQLRYALQRGETETLYPALNDIIHYLKTGNIPLFYVRSLSYELINILSETLIKLGNEQFSNEFLKTYSSFLADFDTIDELADALNKLCMNICLYIVEGILQEKDEKLYKIKYEIETGYADVNFSIQALAERQGMTSAALSQYFKAQTGMTVMEYLTEKRMQKAKELLREGNLTLNEITERIGYINTSSFIRRFKGLYGLTPRQYMASHPTEQQNSTF